MSAAVERPAKARRGPGRHARAVLIAVIGLYLVSETALAPFLPQLFAELFDVHDPSATGFYLWVCRIVGLAALPLWGLAARRWPLHKLVLTGLCGAAVLDLSLGLAPSYTAFTVLSAASVATNAALLLAYPAFISEHVRHAEENTHPDQARIAGVCSIVVVFHLATVVATMTGAGVLALPEPRVGISAFAVLDVVLAVLIVRVLGRMPAEQPTGEDAESAGITSGTLSDSTPAERPRRRRLWLLLLAQAALIGVAFDAASTVVRPFFTELARDMGSGAVGAAVLFFLPSVAALVALVAVRRVHDRLGDRLLPIGLLLAAAGLACQYVASGLPALAAGRVLFGLGLGFGQVAVELVMFRATGTKGPAFTAVETVRSIGLIAAPLVAAAAVSRELALPLLIAAVLMVCASLLATIRPDRRDHRERPSAPPSGRTPQVTGTDVPATAVQPTAVEPAAAEPTATTAPVPAPRRVPAEETHA
ncbi:MFS transporter [Streptomyces durbertensis]|uniref:MFS transporter n=1 Tax=Streptomyces durbertensis TaxID=2448886 RepID=A0ABR6ELK4_9ACTN|nr:MFS transporter [Streptomyces durbertensis]MBB1245820.1 MFS transporter [Streptomyces durbertensis]